VPKCPLPQSGSAGSRNIRNSTISIISGKLYILDLLRAWLVHNPEMNTETIITITGFLGAVLLLLDIVIVR
jgi:hypothetical protein